MNTLLDALLALQAQDDVVDALQERLDALAPRLAELDVVRQRALKSIEETRAGVDSDERRQRVQALLQCIDYIVLRLQRE